MNAVGQLFRDVPGRFAVTGAETLVIAIGTSAAPLTAITVGAGKTGVDGYLLYFIGEFCRKKFGKISIWFVV